VLSQAPFFLAREVKQLLALRGGIRKGYPLSASWRIGNLYCGSRPRNSYTQKIMKTTSWGRVARWYDEAVESKGSYQRDLILPNLLRLMEIQKGERILDLACGQGFFARAFRGAGGKVAASDISREMLAVARKKSGREIEYYAAPAHSLHFLKNERIDKIAIVLAIQNIENLNKTIAECARVLRAGGKLYLVMNHPAFRIPRNSSWGFDESTRVQYRRVDQYLSNRKIEIDIHPGKKAGEQTVSFHRPLQTYVKALAKHNFCIRRLEEWSSRRKSQKGPRAQAEDTARKEIPLFLTIEAQKMSPGD
jgi:ubiquinone/menaquinone biosynthesis C-methylase UbiE